MIRRLLAVVGAFAAVFVAAVPVSADAGTVTQTVHFSSIPETAAVLPCSPVAGLVVINENDGNGVMHMNFNSNGFWETATYAGDVQLLPATAVTVDPNTGNVTGFTADANRPTAQGRVADWFGISFNRTVVIQHDTVNAQLMTSEGQAFSLHALDHAQGIPQPFPNPPIITRQFSTFTCS